jgi:hypothetical protein
MTKSEISKLNAKLTLEFLKKGGTVKRLACKKITVKKTASAGSPKRRSEFKGFETLVTSSQCVGMFGYFANHELVNKTPLNSKG